eukprot:6010093-Prymnesium_polylepis.1
MSHEKAPVAGAAACQPRQLPGQPQVRRASCRGSRKSASCRGRAVSPPHHSCQGCRKSVEVTLAPDPPPKPPSGFMT